MIRKTGTRRFKNMARHLPGIRNRVRMAWRQNKRLLLCAGACCGFAVVLFLGLRWHQNADASAHDVVQIDIGMQGGVTGTSPNGNFDTGASFSPGQPTEVESSGIITVTASPDNMQSSAPEPPVSPTASPTPVDFDDLISFYMLEADRYYNDDGYSSNHYAYTDDELYMLAQVIYGEARGESSKGKIAVANVVMNRVLSRGFPGDTIKAVITAAGQFTGYSASIRPDSACKYAARQVLEKEVWVIPQNVYFFHSNSNLSDGENWGTHKYYARIGVHAFYTENYRGRNRNGKIPPALYERVFKWPQYGCEPGQRVYRIQYMLNQLGYDVKADGYFGKTTKEAVVAFQTKMGLKADAVAGPSTIKALIREFGLDEYGSKFGS